MHLFVLCLGEGDSLFIFINMVQAAHRGKLLLGKLNLRRVQVRQNPRWQNIQQVSFNFSTNTFKNRHKINELSFILNLYTFEQ